MRNLIPRLQVVVARDRSRADRVLAGLVIGQEVFLTRLTDELFKVSDSLDPESSRVLGVLPAEWSGRISEAERSGRQCRAWYVGELPQEKSPDGSFRMLLTIWCSSGSRSGWRDITVEELLRTARVQDEPMPDSQPQRSPFLKSRIHDRVPPRMPLVADRTSAAQQKPAGAPAPPNTPALNAPSAPQPHTSGLSDKQIDLIKEAVRRKLAQKNGEA